jgi:NAD(P)-dependent dehydrogenase (short-subunit alcohol dehydrogenase family)
MASNDGNEKTSHALIVGAGSGLSAALARRAAREGMVPLLAARNIGKLADLIEECGAAAFACDVGRREDVDALFDWALGEHGIPDLVVYNPSARVRGPIAELDPDAVEQALRITAFGGFLVGQAAAKAMLPRGSGTILFTGATASVKGYAQSAPFAMGKFALRGLTQSMARELHPKGIHVGHFLIDGGIGPATDPLEQSRLHPDAIAELYFQFHGQARSVWSTEVDLRAFDEPF